jgi:hypothetical protein
MDGRTAYFAPERSVRTFKPDLVKVGKGENILTWIEKWQHAVDVKICNAENDLSFTYSNVFSWGVLNYFNIPSWRNNYILLRRLTRTLDPRHLPTKNSIISIWSPIRTIWAQCCLTSVIEWVWVCPTCLESVLPGNAFQRWQ